MGPKLSRFGRRFDSGRHPGWTVEIERHELGPRLYVGGIRVHEWMFGLVALVVFLTPAAIDHAFPLHLGALFGLVGAWLVAKDWRDLVPSLQNTGAWRVGIHRRPAPLAIARRGSAVPPLLGFAAAVVGAIDVVGALTPRLLDRLPSVLQRVPGEWLTLGRAAVVPAGLALVLLGIPLARGRRRAWALALVLLTVVGVVDLIRARELVEGGVSLALAGLLWWARDGFVVRHQPGSLRPLVWRLPAVSIGAYLATLFSVWITAPSGHGIDQLSATASARLIFAPVASLSAGSWISSIVGAAGFAAIAFVVASGFRPLPAPRGTSSVVELGRAEDLVRAHGRDTLSFFKLRRDVRHLFDSRGEAVLAYRAVAGVAVVSGDPIGPATALPGLVRGLLQFTQERDLHVAVVGASEAAADLYRQAGLSRLYMGDEAIVDTQTFSLEGRQVRKIRQSVARLERAGYSIEATCVTELDANVLGQLGDVSARWRGTSPEIGFSMAMDGLGGGHQTGSVVVIARDENAAPRGFVHLVPCFGRSAMSLAAMRRDRDTPNGLMELLIVRAIEHLRAEGVDELSLNFAAFGRWLDRPQNLVERMLGRAVRRFNRWFQVESLLRFNEKFSPRWEPRYLCFQGATRFPRAAAAVMLAEGQLRRPQTSVR